MDLAQLGLSVSAREVIQARQALREMGAEAAKTETAVDQLKNTQKGAGQSASALSANLTLQAQKQRELAVAHRGGADMVQAHERRWRGLEAQLRLSADATEEERREVDRLARELYDAERAADQMGDEAAQASRQVDRLGDESSETARALGFAARAAAVFIATLGARELLEIADAYTLLQGRVNLYSDSQEQTQAVMAGIENTAVRLGTSISAVGEIYARLAPAQDQLGYSSRELLTITEAISTAMIVSGASQQEAEAAIVQLSQGLASGTLRGEEFNAVAEQAPRLLQVLSDTLGVNTGELREMAAEGELTAGVVGNALLGSASDLRSELDQLPETVSRASSALQTELSSAWAEFNEELRITQRLANGLRATTDFIRDYRIGVQFDGLSEDEIRDELDKINRTIESYTDHVTQNTPLQFGDSISAARILSRGALGDARKQGGNAAVLEALWNRQTEGLRALAAAREEVASSGNGNGGGTNPTETLEKEIVLNEALVALTEQKARQFEEEQRARENSLRLAEYQLDTQLAIAELSGDEDVIRMLERERDIRRDIQAYLDMGVAAEEARTMAANNADLRDTARRQGEIRETVRGGLSDGFRDWAETGDVNAIGRNIAVATADGLIERLSDRASDAIIGLIFDEAAAVTEGIAQGTAAGTAMGTAITHSGAVAGASMAKAITTAGTAVAAQMAAATAAGGGNGGIDFAAILSGARATYGTVLPGGVYAVNEVGQEVFAPSVPGQIVPLSSPAGNQSAGQTVFQQHFHLHAEGAVMTDELLKEMDDKANRAASSASAHAQKQMNDRAREQRLSFTR